MACMNINDDLIIVENAIEEEDVDTIGGLVVKLLGRIAEVNDSVEFKNFTFIVKEIDGARITKLEIIKNIPDTEEVTQEE